MSLREGERVEERVLGRNKCNYHELNQSSRAIHKLLLNKIAITEFAAEKSLPIYTKSNLRVSCLCNLRIVNKGIKWKW